MQTLFIPDIVRINLLHKDSSPLRQKNILVGIQTFATHKNNIDISPFLSNPDGQIIITKEEIKQRADIFVSYGIMDYDSLETARPGIRIYYWGNDSLDRLINHWKANLENKQLRVRSELETDLLRGTEDLIAAIRKREAEDLEIFSLCFNRQMDIKDNIILVSDVWDKPQKERSYTANLPV